MAIAASAKRYAQAVFQIAREQDTFDQWADDLATLGDLAQDQVVAVVMASPRVTMSTKVDLLKDRAGSSSSLAMQLALLLLQKRRFNLLADVHAAYSALLDTHRGIEHVQLTTAIPLEQTERDRFVEQLQGRLGKQVVLTATVNTDIIGGAVIRLGDKLIDGSTRGRLDALQRQLAGAR